MRLDKVHIKGFRNFDDVEFCLAEKTLIIGANDVGKTNLIYALRLLFDRTLSDHALDLSDSDYNAYTGADTIEITVTIKDVHENCLISCFVGALKDEQVVIQYRNSKQGQYSIWAGFDEATLIEKPGRFYIRRLNMQCVDTNRDLNSFLKHERAKLLRYARENLEKTEAEADNVAIQQLQSALDGINSQIGELHFVSSALDTVNQELAALSIHNEDQEVSFIAGESNADRLLDNLTLAYRTSARALAIGGDGRNNQIFLATWIAEQTMQENVDHVTFFAIEEPEAHLHPHQQRKLSDYIVKHLTGNVLITTHSPHIACKFSPDSMIRLLVENKKTQIACAIGNKGISRAFDGFGYRLNVISSETFFSNGIFLVEGVSEVMFYTALSEAIGIDLDRLNISILSVEGVGFKPYVALCQALNIPWILRTDNDVFYKTVDDVDIAYYAGVSRAVGIIEEATDVSPTDEMLFYWKEHSEENEWKKGEAIPDTALKLHQRISALLVKKGIYLSKTDLENDMVESPLSSMLQQHYNIQNLQSLVKKMQKKKAENMLDFLRAYASQFNCLESDTLALPLFELKRKVERMVHPVDAE